MATEQLVADLAFVKLLLTLAVLLLLGGVMLAARSFMLTRSLERKSALLQECVILWLEALNKPSPDRDDAWRDLYARIRR